MDRRHTAFFHVDTDGLAAIHRGHGRTHEGRDEFFLSAVDHSLRFFEGRGALATYFVIGEDLEREDKRSALLRVVDAGHRVACHGMRHRYLDRSTTAEKREEIVDAKAKIEDVLGTECIGFRAPGYSIDMESLELLAEAGYCYDSSVFPTFAFREKLGTQRLLPEPFEILPDHGLMEFPMPTGLPGLPPFHPAYAFYLRLPYFRLALRSFRKRAEHLTLLFHFTDFAEKQADIDGLRLQVFTNNFFSGASKLAFLGRLADEVAKSHDVTTTEAFLAAGRHEAPSLRPRTILGVSTTHETGACLVRDGTVLAAVTEERLTRKKLDNRYPPVGSIAEVIAESGIDPSEIDAVAIAGLEWRDLLPQTWASFKQDVADFHAWNDYFPHFVRILYRFFYFLRATSYGGVREHLEREFGIRPPVHYIEHHAAHAASAFRTGEVDEATVITADGVGDDVSITFSQGRGRSLTTIKRFYYPNSFGQFYTACTQILGFKAGRHEGKITGLAGYGTPNAELIAKVRATYQEKDDFRLGKYYYSEGFPRLRKGTIRALLRGDGIFSFEYRNYKAPLKRLLEGYSREEVAWAYQRLLEEEMVRLARTLMPEGTRNIALAGGVFANVKLNMALSQELQPESIYIFPAMGDGGLAVGAALEVGATSPRPLPNAYLGSHFEEEAIQRAIDAHPELEVDRPGDLPAFVARRLAEGKIVARFDGCMEFGPRALGNRSILYQCGDPSVNRWLNEQLDRTEFMPFAPMCIYEDADDYFVLREGELRACEFMTLVVDCTDKMKDTCPAAVHVDGTARPQLVKEEENPGMYAILQAYKRLTGISCTINTSFNMHEEPIVRTPEEAINAFQRSNLDWLVLGPFVTRVKPAAGPGQGSGAA